MHDFAEHYRGHASHFLGRALMADDAVVLPEGIQLPEALRDVYATFGKVAALTTVHHRLLPFEKLEVADGMLIFYEENQGVVSWGLRQPDLSEPDPLVYQGTDTSEGWEWFSEEIPVSQWMIVMMCWQLVNGGFDHAGFSAGTTDAQVKVAAKFPVLVTDPKGELRFYGNGSQIICLTGSEVIPSVWAAARTREDFEAMDKALEFDWDYCSVDDE